MSENFASTTTEGYARLGQLMGEAPENAIFRRFGALSAELLLYRQAELAGLERDLREQQVEDKTSTSETRRDYAVNFRKLRSSGDDDCHPEDDDTQWRLVQEIEEKLEKYHKALDRHSRMLRLRSPQLYQVQSLDEWMQRPSMGGVYLVGPDCDIWKEPDLDDLVALEPETMDDSYLADLTMKLIYAYHQILGRHIHKPGTKSWLHNSIRYNNERILTIFKVMITFGVCLFTAVGIAGLYSIASIPARLTVMAIFTTLFSFALALTTSAPMHDIFAVTAAFAAVLVVFVSANSNNCSTTSGASLNSN